MAIVLAGVLVAGAIIFTKGNAGGEITATTGGNDNKEISLRPVTDDDHILGNPDAEIVIVEYSDTECPFCKQFHKTMQAIIAEYGTDGRVAWVYRHFPLVQLHPKAPKEAEALECAGELGGKSAFWDYTNRVYEVTPANNGLDPEQLLVIAEELKIDRTAFETCLNSGRYTEKVQADYQDAIAAGGRGTPHSIIITRDGDKLPIEGAQPLATVKSIIDGLLKAN